MKIKNHGILKTSLPQILGTNGLVVVVWYLEDYNQDSISPQNFELDQYQPIDKLASFYFNDIELEDECDIDFQCWDSVQLFESILTSVSLPDLDPILEPILILSL